MDSAEAAPAAAAPAPAFARSRRPQPECASPCPREQAPQNGLKCRIGTAKASAKEKKETHSHAPRKRATYSEKLFKMGKFVRATYTEDSPSLSSDSAAKLLGGCDCPRASPKRQAGPQYGRAEAMLRRRLAAPAAAPSALLLHLRRRQAAGSLPSKSAHLLALCSSAWLRSPLPRAAH